MSTSLARASLEQFSQNFLPQNCGYRWCQNALGKSQRVSQLGLTKEWIRASFFDTAGLRCIGPGRLGVFRGFATTGSDEKDQKIDSQRAE